MTKTDLFDYGSARLYLRKKQENLKNKRFALWQQAQQDAQQIITMIINKYTPKRIIQWGSVLESKHFSEASDIDIAVEGLDSIEFMRLLKDAEDMTNFSLDLIRWENVNNSFQKILLRKGKIVYGK
ncbi:nucleotidyltransferase family protein [Geminocystis sp. CENA526]|uniref:nucleotidyltransferase family protein n=1 Tax=Geminocystis sp. CENA526 TaxID=1355871 RepID=UPI003D6F5BB8